MTHRTTAASFILLVASVPFFASAANACPNLTRSLVVGARGSDVLELQRYLINDGELLSDYATGYFGSLTQTAVGSWQRAHGVVASRDTAGWGTVGPRTRAAIVRNCDPILPTRPPDSSPTASTTLGTSPGQCRAVPQPASLCSSGWRGVRGSNGCLASWFCIASATTSSTEPISSTSTAGGTNKPPVVTRFLGPVLLDVGEVGQWTVYATDPEGGALMYGFIWGDSGSAAFDQIQRFSQSFTDSPSAMHAYMSAGSYQLAVTVHDTAGNSTEASVTVGVPRTASAATSTGMSSCTSAAGVYQHGQVVSGQLISGGPFTYSVVVPQYTCTNGTWVCTQYCSTPQNTSTTTGKATTTIPLTNGAQFWCFTSTTGYWSSTPCANKVEHDPTKIDPGNPFGSSDPNANIGGICAPEGRHEFKACPSMQNCFGGGTYLVCKNGFWAKM